MILIFDKLLSKQWVYTAGARVIVVCIKSYPRLKYFLKCENIQTSLLFVDKGDVINLRGDVYVCIPLDRISTLSTPPLSTVSPYSIYHPPTNTTNTTNTTIQSHPIPSHQT